jgi:hypothetical protein
METTAVNQHYLQNKLQLPDLSGCFLAPAKGGRRPHSRSIHLSAFSMKSL